MQRSSFQENGLNAHVKWKLGIASGHIKQPFALGPRSISLPAAVTCVAMQSQDDKSQTRDVGWEGASRGQEVALSPAHLEVGNMSHWYERYQ